MRAAPEGTADPAEDDAGTWSDGCPAARAGHRPAGRPRTGSTTCAWRGRRASSACSRSSAPGCWPACPTTTRPGSPPTRSSAPTTATGCCGCWSLSTVALIVFHELARAHRGRHRQGAVRSCASATGAGPRLVAVARWSSANIGTLCAELAGVASARSCSSGREPVRRGAGRRAGRLGAGAREQLPPRRARAAGAQPRVRRLRRGGHPRPSRLARRGARAGGARDAASTRGGPRSSVATLGTTLAPWGLAFMQSYAVDKRLDRRRPRLRAGRRDHRRAPDGHHRLLRGRRLRRNAAPARASSIEDGGDAARALEPLAGSSASLLFGLGILGAGLLAAAIVPLSTAYSVCEAAGHARGPRPAAPRRRRSSTARTSWSMAVAAAIVLVPGVPLVPVLYLTQVAERGAAAGDAAVHGPRWGATPASWASTGSGAAGRRSASWRSPVSRRPASSWP